MNERMVCYTTATRQRRSIPLCSVYLVGGELLPHKRFLMVTGKILHGRHCAWRRRAFDIRYDYIRRFTSTDMGMGVNRARMKSDKRTIHWIESQSNPRNPLTVWLRSVSLYVAYTYHRQPTLASIGRIFPFISECYIPGEKCLLILMRHIGVDYSST